MAAHHIAISTEYEKYKDAYSDAVQAAVASLGSLVVIIIGYFVVWYYNKKSEEVILAPENGDTVIPESVAETTSA